MKQVRTTSAKSTIVETLEEAGHALSHAELYVILGNTCDRVTIYRILSRLVEEGLAHRVALQDGTVKFALCEECNTEGHHHSHPHFSCNLCSTVTCLTMEIPVVILPKKFKMEETSYVISGVCATCR
ncbi:MAG: transcriptional repressor [Flavobacteriales bacterium]|nr:transcriptional repressor [Flavobacteriales bacterium]